MIINSIILRDFRQFKGTQKIEFSTDKDKNVTFVLANNGVGKTTLLKAFKWCLYGKNDFPSDGGKSLLSIIVEKELEIDRVAEASVEINLSNDDNTYTIIRKAFYRKTVNGLISDRQDKLIIETINKIGNTSISEDDIQNKVTVEKILPDRLSSFFLFEGENIDKVGQELSTNSHIANAVKGLLGLGFLEKAMAHLKEDRNKNVIKDLEKTYVSSISLDQINEMIETLNQNIFNLKKQIDDYSNAIANIDKELENKEEQVKKNGDTQEIANERSDYTEQLRKYEKEKEGKKEKLIEIFNNESYLFCLRYLLEKSVKILNNRNDLDSGYPKLVAETVNYILKKGICICGENISNSSKHKECLREKLKSIPPESIGVLISEFKKDCQNLLNNSKTFEDNISSFIDDIVIKERDILYFQQKIDGCNMLLKDSLNVGEIIQSIQDLTIDKTRKMQIIEDSKNKKIEFEEQLEKYKNERDDIASQSVQNTLVNKRIHYAEEIYNKIKTEYNEREQRVRNELAKSMEDNFALFHGSKYQIELTSDYKVLFKSNGSIVNMSGGHGVCMVLSLVTSIIKLRSEYLQEKNIGFKLANTDFPFIMDAPLSNLQADSIDAVCKKLPDMVRQIIFFTMDTNASSAKKNFGSRIGKSYELVRVKNLYTEIRGE